MATMSAVPWRLGAAMTTSRSSPSSTSLSVLRTTTAGGSKSSKFSVSASFSGSLSFSLRSSFSGLSLGGSFSSNRALTGRSQRFVVRAGKAALCQTKRSRSRKSLARVHGFRKRMSTPSGRAVLQRRRAKGRRILVTKTNHSCGKPKLSR